MATDNEKQVVELTNRITEMTEGESPEVLAEIVKLLTYHAGYHAGELRGDHSFKEVISKNIEELIW